MTFTSSTIASSSSELKLPMFFSFSSMLTHTARSYCRFRFHTCFEKKCTLWMWNSRKHNLIGHFTANNSLHPNNSFRVFIIMLVLLNMSYSHTTDILAIWCNTQRDKNLVIEFALKTTRRNSSKPMLLTFL